MEKESDELNDEIFKKKTKFWKRISLISNIVCFILCLASIIFNFIYNKLSGYLVFALAITFLVVVLVACFFMFFSWLKLRRLEMKFCDSEQENDESEPDN